MSKLLVETKGAFELLDLSTGTLIHCDRPSVAEASTFVHHRTSVGQVLILGECSAEATDDEFLAYWKEADGDRDLAVSSFLAVYGPEAVPAEEKPAPRRRKGA